MSLGMQSTLQQLSKSVYVVVGPDGATNFAIVKAADTSAVVIDADIRRIGIDVAPEVEAKPEAKAEARPTPPAAPQNGKRPHA